MFFSIIIPTYNRYAQLATCLECLNDQQLNRHEWEVIVVDDGSEKNNKEIIEGLSLNYSWYYFYQENSGPAKARNHGANKAKGKYLVFLDDDCEADKAWLVKLKAKMEPGTLFGGKIINKLNENIFSEASQLLVSYLYETLLGTTQMFFTTNNFALDRKSFLEVGAFNTEFQLAAGEDREFSVRFSHLGHALKYVPEAVTLHSHQLSFKLFLRQHFNYGRSNHTFRAIMKQFKINLYLNDTWFFIRLLFYPLRIKKYPLGKSLVLACLIGMTQASYASGYLFEIVRQILRKALSKNC